MSGGVTSRPGTDPHPIVLFDGVCNFCNRSVNFVIKRDKRRYFRFAPLQTAKGGEIARRHGIDPELLDTLCSSRMGGRTGNRVGRCASPGGSGGCTRWHTA